MDHFDNMRRGRRELRQLRDDRKAAQGSSYDAFYYEVARALAERSGVRVSPGWVREQCLGGADPSYVRFGALLEFLEDYAAGRVRLGSDVEAGPSGEEEGTPYLDALRREHLASLQKKR